MAIECPHCYLTIIPLASGTCPACRQDTRDRSRVDPDRVTRAIGEKANLPEICCDCGGIARRVVRVASDMATSDPGRPSARNTEEADEVGGFVLRRLFGRHWGRLFTWMVISAGSMGSGSGRNLNVTVRVRQCAECARRKKVEPVHVDFDYCRMKFVVHRRFAEQYDGLNANPAVAKAAR
jgi:hypothetical protein